MPSYDVFPIQEIEIPPGDRREEQLGTKAKFWYTDRDGTWTLFKAGRPNEDWSEKAAAELAKLLGLPCALIELALCKDTQGRGTRGTVSPSFLSAGDELIHGNAFLLQRSPDYPRKAAIIPASTR